MKPRDLYDIVHIFNDSRSSPDQKKSWNTGKEISLQKCGYLQWILLMFNARLDKADLNANWDSMLADLNPPEKYWDQLPGVFM